MFCWKVGILSPDIQREDLRDDEPHYRPESNLRQSGGNKNTERVLTRQTCSTGRSVDSNPDDHTDRRKAVQTCHRTHSKHNTPLLPSRSEDSKPPYTGQLRVLNACPKSANSPRQQQQRIHCTPGSRRCKRTWRREYTPSGYPNPSPHSTCSRSKTSLTSYCRTCNPNPLRGAREREASVSKRGQVACVG